MPLFQSAHGGGSETQGCQAIERGGTASAQQVAQHYHPRVFAGALLQRFCDLFSDAAQPFGVSDLGGLQNRTRTVGRFGSFGNYDDGVHAPHAVALQDLVRDLFQVEGNFRDQNGVGAAGDACVKRDPARVAAHDFDHHHPLMALRRGVKAVQALGGEGDRGVEAEGGEGLVDVIVDGLWYAHHAQPFLVQGVGDGERAIAADGNQRVQFPLGEELQDFAGAIRIPGRAVLHFHREMQRVAFVGGAEDGAAQMPDAPHLVAVEAVDPALGIALRKQDAIESIADAVAFPAAMDGSDDYRADDRIETRGVTPAGADGDAANRVGHGNPAR